MLNGKHKEHVVIVGGGFGGLYAAKMLSRAGVKITVIDKRNFHLFQPLLYQVAAGWLSPGEIASPLRVIFSRCKNVYVQNARVTDIDPEGKKVIFKDGELHYDTLIVATGSNHHYFGHDEWAETAPGLKTIEDALTIRKKILLSFEAAERDSDPEEQRAWMTFLIIGAGPTGVELAGTIAELSHATLKSDFRNIDTTKARIILVEAADRVLRSYPPELSRNAGEELTKLGVEIRLNTMVKNIQHNTASIEMNGSRETIQARTILWTAGVKASRLGKTIEERTGAPLDNMGRVVVNTDLSVPGYPDILVIGDLANYSHQGTEPLPGVAQVAMQEGRYAASLIEDRIKGKETAPFKYQDKGSLAIIGSSYAVADLGRLRFSGFFAWLVWALIHIGYLIEFENRAVVFFRWAWNYFTRKRGVRLITGEDPLPLVKKSRDWDG